MVTLVFTLLLGRLAGLKSMTDGTSYSLYVFAGMLLWMLFASGTTHCSQSLVGMGELGDQGLLSPIDYSAWNGGGRPRGFRGQFSRPRGHDGDRTQSALLADPLLAPCSSWPWC